MRRIESVGSGFSRIRIETVGAEGTAVEEEEWVDSESIVTLP